MKKKKTANLIMVLIIAVIAIAGVTAAFLLKTNTGSGLGSQYKIQKLQDNAVLTSDKFTALFGNVIPALSLLLVMVLRLIPNLMRKAAQIAGARKSIGKGAAEGDTNREKLEDGMSILGALTSWALEGSVVTADSMRSRGYGTSKRTSFQIYRMTGLDVGLLAALVILFLLAVFVGNKTANFTPIMDIARIDGWNCLGLIAYAAFLLLPTALHIKEAIQWHISRSRI